MGVKKMLTFLLCLELIMTEYTGLYKRPDAVVILKYDAFGGTLSVTIAGLISFTGKPIITFYVCIFTWNRI